MHTHILYRACGKRYKQYFAGTYTGKIDSQGFVEVDFKWSTDIKDATPLIVTDAWDLLHMCRKAWEHLTLEVARIKQFSDV